MANLLHAGAAILVITWIISIISYADGIVAYILLAVMVAALLVVFRWKKTI